MISIWYPKHGLKVKIYLFVAFFFVYFQLVGIFKLGEDKFKNSFRYIFFIVTFSSHYENYF